MPLTLSKETDHEPVEGENEPVKGKSEPVEVGNGTAGRENEPVEPKNEPVGPDMPPFQVQLLNLIRENPDITYDQMAETTGKGRSTIRRHVKALREQKLLRRVGSDRHGHWDVTEAPPPNARRRFVAK